MMAGFDRLSQLESLTRELATTVKVLANYCRTANIDPCLVPAEAPKEAHSARGTILASVAKVQTLLDSPVDLLQRLATQNQLLACLHWLGEFQVLACVPSMGSVPMRDVADLSGVPADQLSSMIRMTATAGFFHEPASDQVAHTVLSAAFVDRPSLLDAVMFLAASGAPAALHMAEATRRYGTSTHARESAYSLALDPRTTFQAACEQRPKLRRQWAAYLHYVGGADEAGVTDVLTRLNWLVLGNACVVEVDAPSCVTASALAQFYPALNFVVQIAEQTPGATPRPEPPSLASSARITVQTRVPGTPQMVTDAAVYIFRVPLPHPCPSMPSQPLPVRVTSELRAHLGVLRVNRRAMFILTARPLPEPGTVEPSLEALGRLGELSLLQLANERAVGTDELVEMLEGVGDEAGRLVVNNRLLSSDQTTVALVAKYQPYGQKF